VATNLDVWRVAKDLSFPTADVLGVTSLKTTGHIASGVLTVGMERIPVIVVGLLLACPVCRLVGGRYVGRMLSMIDFLQFYH